MTVLLDFFRRGEVPREIRLLAAEGSLAPSAHEQLGLLVLLTADADAEVARTAEATIATIPRASLETLLAGPDVGADIKAFFAARHVAAGSVAGSGTSALEQAPLVPVKIIVDSVTEPEPESSALQRIAALNVAQRMALAMKGTREERAILIRDPNKIVAVAVLSSPKITDAEVEAIAKMGSVSDEILRLIANTRAWIKNYPVVVALARNAKTPLAVSMNLLSRLNDKDLRMLSTDRNVPDVLRITARKKVVIDR